ncbi:unnamed protein product [Ambrosiozyma monospora]|uniref:cellulase n=1 Tax=Ambrosiozyma monospora TaxID=43982 RepID=A0A9W6TAX9_AMBMO|nr:unnamed protein product [Ambrosiozyma monospora]
MLSKTSILLLLSSLMINAAPLAETDASDSSSSTIPLYYQCGGINWTGATQCVEGATCYSQNDYYYQCIATENVPSATAAASVAATTTPAANTVETSDAESGSLANTASVGHEKKASTTYSQTATEDTVSSEVLQSSTIQKTTLSTSNSVLSTKAGSNAVTTSASVSTKISSIASSSASVSTKPSSIASSASAASSSASASSDSSSSSDIKTVSGGFSGSTDITRYWDCCAPSFCWEGKSNSTSGRVAVCDSNGDKLEVDGNNFQSGCVGGKAYMCPDQVPWAINDNLAYG